MAFDDLLQLLARGEAVTTKQAEVMRLVTQATIDSLESGGDRPRGPGVRGHRRAPRGDGAQCDPRRGGVRAEGRRPGTRRRRRPEAAVAEAKWRQDASAAALAAIAGKAAEYAAAATPGGSGEAAALAATAEKFSAFMRHAAAMPAAPAAAPWDSDSDLSEAAARPATIRTRRRNTKYPSGVDGICPGRYLRNTVRTPPPVPRPPPPELRRGEALPTFRTRRADALAAPPQT
ncbi:unnamed protein product [Urochloa humidicola]